VFQEHSDSHCPVFISLSFNIKSHQHSKSQFHVWWFKEHLTRRDPITIIYNTNSNSQETWPLLRTLFIVLGLFSTTIFCKLYQLTTPNSMSYWMVSLPTCLRTECNRYEGTRKFEGGADVEGDDLWVFLWPQYIFKCLSLRHLEEVSEILNHQMYARYKHHKKYFKSECCWQSVLPLA
jgi:hypothetical protein